MPPRPPHQGMPAGPNQFMPPRPPYQGMGPNQFMPPRQTGPNQFMPPMTGQQRMMQY